MPLISEAASAIKSRFGFQDRNSASESASTVPSSPDLSKSVSRESAASSALSLVPASAAVRSVGQREDGDIVGTGSAPLQTENFDFSEDPSFWKDRNVQVIIRVRPLSSMEISQQGHSKCIRQDSCQSITWTGHPESRFTFDLVADDSVSQEKIFKVAGVPMVDNCVEGYNSCMFAYGQTGSGKTHTMLGDIEGGTRRHSVNCGMTPRVFEYLFSRIQKEKEARQEEKLKFTCRCSFLEIYNEQIFDLLDPSSNNLQIREDVKKGVYVENLKELEVVSARDVIQQLIQGAANRRVAATNMNRASSRSHSVFTCIIESKWESQGIIHHRFARLNLVDLAGSERQKSSGAEGERLKEATNINKSLSTLGLVIMNLVSISNGKTLHVPYRDSKLTFLLQDSLGGNSKTIIIANVSPSLCCSLETLSTLKFAQRAKFIKNNAIVNEDTSGDVVAMRMQIQQLKKEVSRLRGLINGGSENLEHDVISFPGSPISLKWEGLQGSFSPLVSEKRMSQKKDYEVALVGAFRRERDKDIALKALAAENQAALQLAKQRDDEIKGLKMILRFRESGLKRLEAVASGKISTETHLLKEKEEHLKEIEVLRTQVDRNHEATRFAMENLRLKEEIRRLKSFYEEGEREIMNDQIMALQNKLLEALDWKLMHESDSLAVQKGNSCAETEAPGELSILSSQTQEEGSPWHSRVNEENEFLRMQAIQSQAEIDALHNQLDFLISEKEKLERHVNDLLAKLEEERLLGVTKEGTQQIELSASADLLAVNFDNQIELKTMVDAIAAASQREAEAHEKAIVLTKENGELQLKLDALVEANSELQIKLKALIDEKNSLIEMYERAAAEGYKNMDEPMRCEHHDKEILTNGGDSELLRDTEMKTVVKNLEHQLTEMHEENEKLMNLYEKAMHERDEFKRIISSGEQNRVDFRELDCLEKLVEVDGGECFSSCVPPVSIDADCIMEETDVFGLNAKDGENVQVKVTTISAEMEARMNVHNRARQSLLYDESRVNMVDSQENKFLTSVEPPNVTEANILDESVGISTASSKVFIESALCGDHLVDAGSQIYFETFSDMDTELPCLDLVRVKLDSAQERLLDSAKVLTAFGVLEKAFIEFGEVSREIKAAEEELQVKQERLGTLELVSLEMRERKDVIDKKLSALKYCFSSFSSSVDFFEQREARAKARISASFSYLGQKKEELIGLQGSKDELESALRKIQQSEAELRNNITFLKSKLEEENRRQENDKVLFAIDNIEKLDSSQLYWYAGGKATDLLKSEEEKNNLQTDLKLSREKVGLMRKEFEVLNKKLVKIKSEIQAVEMEIQKESSFVEEMELALKDVIQEKESLIEIRKDGMSEIQGIVSEYCHHVLDADLKEGETEIVKEELLHELNRLDELRKFRVATVEKVTELLDDTRLNSCSLSRQMEEKLHGIRASVLEAESILGEGN